MRKNLMLPLFSEPQAKKNYPLAVLVAAIVLLFVGSGLSARSAAIPSRVSEDFFDNLRAGQTDEAWGMTSSAFRQSTSRDSFDRLSDNISNNIKPGGLEAKKRDTVKGTAIGTKTVITGMAHGQDKVYELTCELVKEAGQWKIFAFKISEKKP